MSDSNIQVAGTSGVVLALGIMWGSTPGSGVYDIPFGALQNFSIDGKNTLKELRDPNFQLPSVAAAVQGGIDLKAESAQIRGRALQKVIGGGLTYDAGTGRSLLSVTADRGNNGMRPTAFAVQIKSKNDPNAPVIGTIYNVVSDAWSLPLKPEDFMMNSPSFKCYGDPANGNKVLDLDLDGDHTSDTASAPSAATSLAATPGTAASGIIDLSWTAGAGATEYDVLRGTAAGAEVWIASVTGTHFQDWAVSGSTYYYKILARSGAGSALAYSNEVSQAAP